MFGWVDTIRRHFAMNYSSNAVKSLFAVMHDGSGSDLELQ